MSIFAFLMRCIQACLVQNVFGQYLGGGGCGCGGPVVYGSTLGLGTGHSPAATYGGALDLSAYGGAIGSAYGGAIAPATAYGGAIASGAAYGGFGEGNVVVIGELPVAGNTAVAGQVPVIGVVSFGGAVPAAGVVSISGQCGCGCGSPLY